MSGLTIEGLQVSAPGVTLVDGIDLSIAPGKVLGLVGESGSGKSLSLLSIPRLLPTGCQISGGSVRLNGQDLTGASERELRALRGGEIGVIFQDPFKSLNPVRRVGDLIAESARRHRGLSASAARQEAIDALAAVGVPDPERRARAFPHQLSGGQRQRALIAMALINQPSLLLADEPTTALDPTVQVQILDLIRAAAQRAGVIFVTHDLGAAAYLCDEIAVMYAGRIVEWAPTASLIAAPQHPYTAALLACTPRLDGVRPRAIAGNPTSPQDRPVGCAFRPRCERAVSACIGPPMLLAHGEGLAACFRPGPGLAA
ncbi:MAG: ABC transporter ATP-binding protein [Pseudomonadota bacterium]|uniref:ABC transporter ATP-binding protein n=1 Tax=Phenylobacterium sp. TaxID=1871053 RepID=UPI0025FCA1E3|nr:ABC transporter ATP-binding protein [Phenylobacterium sp.]MBT9470535.1 ABC transporter ATP-binding protein [Phenylobacterium sp.]